MNLRRALWTVAFAACSRGGPMAPEPMPTDASPPAVERVDGVAKPATDAMPTSTGCMDDSRHLPPEVYATPEAGETPYLEVLHRASKSIHVEIYLLGSGGILDSLIEKAKAGIEVKLILDKSEIRTNQKYADLLTAAGAQVEWSDPRFTFLHAKFFVVDGSEAIISTGNFSTKYSILLERNFVAHLAEPQDIADLVALFDADWLRAATALPCTRLLIAPTNARQRLLDLIRSATTTIAIESMQFSDGDIRAAVAERLHAGVTVRALLANATWIGANTDAAKFLGQLGIPVKSIPHLHAKALVIDGKRAYLGSENFSYNSLKNNREVGLIVVEPSSVQPLLDTFEKDWASAASF